MRANGHDAVCESSLGNFVKEVIRDCDLEISTSSTSNGGGNGGGGGGGGGNCDCVNGVDGLSCWDLDGDGFCSPVEDVNGDQVCDALDCQGADGQDGAPGPAGSDGQDGTFDAMLCPGETLDGGDSLRYVTELNANCFQAVPILDGEDGADGATGPAGPPGADGQDGQDGTFDAMLCPGETLDDGDIIQYVTAQGANCFQARPGCSDYIPWNVNVLAGGAIVNTEHSYYRVCGDVVKFQISGEAVLGTGSQFVADIEPPFGAVGPVPTSNNIPQTVGSGNGFKFDTATFSWLKADAGLVSSTACTTPGQAPEGSSKLILIMIDNGATGTSMHFSIDGHYDLLGSDVCP